MDLFLINKLKQIFDTHGEYLTQMKSCYDFYKEASIYDTIRQYINEETH